MSATGNTTCGLSRLAQACSPTAWFRSLMALRDSPRDIALGSSIGVFIAFTPTIGLQTGLAVLAASLFGTSRVAAIIPVWISNPLTMGPMFAMTYWVGSILCPAGLINPLTDGGYAAATQAGTAPSLLSAGIDLLLPLAIGGMVVGLVCAVVTYPLMKYAVVVVRHKNAQRKH